jgi:hypothetical protein
LPSVLRSPPISFMVFAGDVAGEASGFFVDVASEEVAEEAESARLFEGRIRITVEALAAHDPEVALLDEVLVEVAGGLKRLVFGVV